MARRTPSTTDAPVRETPTPPTPDQPGAEGSEWSRPGRTEPYPRGVPGANQIESQSVRAVLAPLAVRPLRSDSTTRTRACNDPGVWGRSPCRCRIGAPTRSAPTYPMKATSRASAHLPHRRAVESSPATRSGRTDESESSYQSEAKPEPGSWTSLRVTFKSPDTPSRFSACSRTRVDRRRPEHNAEAEPSRRSPPPDSQVSPEEVSGAQPARAVTRLTGVHRAQLRAASAVHLTRLLPTSRRSY